MRAKSNLFSSYAFIIINILINLFVVRLNVRFFGDELYAFIVLAFSFISYVECLNLGVYLSNRTQIPLRGNSISTFTIASFRLLSLVALIGIIGTQLLFHFTGDWLISLITTQSDLNLLEVGKNAIHIAIIFGFLKVPLSLALQAFAGQDRVDIEKKYNALQQIVKILSLFLVIQLGGTILNYLFLFAVANIFVLIGANIHYYKKFIYPKQAFFVRYSRIIKFNSILSRSYKFFVYSMAVIFVWSTDNLIISIFFDPKMVTDYHINFSIYNAAFLFITAIATALLANYGNLIRDKEFDKLNYRINLSVTVTLIIGLAIAVGGVLFAEDIINLWVGSGHFISSHLLLSYALFGVSLSFSSVIHVILALFASSRIITSMTISEVLFNLILSLFLLNYIGVTGVALASGIAAFTTIVIPGGYFIKQHFKSKVKLDIRPICFHIILATMTIGLILGFVPESFYQKVLIFIVYSFVAFFLVALLNKDYLRSVQKVLKGKMDRES